MGFLKPPNISTYPEPPEVYNWRMYWLAISASFGSAMFGYDVGFIGSAIALTSFKARFHLTAAASTALSSNIVSTFLAGAFFGALLVYPVVDRLGPKIAMLTAGTLFLFGSILTVVSPGLIGLIYAGRAFTGLGVGIVSLVVPVYISECSPPALRGRLVSIFECTLQLGQIVGFWVNYGVARHIADTDQAQWRIPFALQIVPAALFIGSIIFQPNSPRFLIKTGKLDEASRVFSYLRQLPRDHEFIQSEITRVQNQLESDLSLTQGDRSLGAKIRLLRTRSNIKRLVIGSALMTFLALTGINSINYFSPTIIKGLGFKGTLETLLASGIYGAVKGSFCIAFSLFGVDRFGRRNALILGSAGASFSLFYIAIYTAVSGSFSGQTGETPGAYAALVFIYVYAVFLSFSWTGIPWLYCAEIFPPVVRPVATVGTTMMQWLIQFVIVYATPYMIKAMTWGVFVFFGVCTVVGGLFVTFYVPETRNIPLEHMDQLFSMTGNASHHRRKLLDILTAESENSEGISVEEK